MLYFAAFFALTSMFFLHQMCVSDDDTDGWIELACALSLASLFLALVCAVRAYELWGA